MRVVYISNTTKNILLAFSISPSIMHLLKIWSLTPLIAVSIVATPLFCFLEPTKFALRLRSTFLVLVRYTMQVRWSCLQSTRKWIGFFLLASANYITDQTHYVSSSSQASACIVEVGSTDDIAQVVWATLSSPTWSTDLEIFLYRSRSSVRLDRLSRSNLVDMPRNRDSRVHLEWWYPWLALRPLRRQQTRSPCFSEWEMWAFSSREIV